MSHPNPTLDPTAFGLPSRDELVDLRIWDLHYHGVYQHEEVVKYVDRMGIERVFALGIGSYRDDPDARASEERERQLLKDWPDLMFGITIIDPNRLDLSLEKMDEWLVDGPCVGIKYSGVGGGPLTCDHPNNDPIIEKAADNDAVIYIHTWIKVDENNRTPGTANLRGESTPMDVAELAQRHPDVPLICGHAGGDWEIAIRAIRPYENVFLEFSGGSSWAGAVEYAVEELGSDRIVWGGHLPSRSYANELGKVFDADLTEKQQFQILGGNLRAMTATIAERKGYDISG